MLFFFCFNMQITYQTFLKGGSGGAGDTHACFLPFYVRHLMMQKCIYPTQILNNTAVFRLATQTTSQQLVTVFSTQKSEERSHTFSLFPLLFADGKGTCWLQELWINSRHSGKSLLPPQPFYIAFLLLIKFSLSSLIMAAQQSCTPVRLHLQTLCTSVAEQGKPSDIILSLSFSTTVTFNAITEV